MNALYTIPIATIERIFGGLLTVISGTIFFKLYQIQPEYGDEQADAGRDS